MIDEKGMLKIFKWKINIIDFVIIVFVICTICCGITMYKNATKPIEYVPRTTYTIYRTCPICNDSQSIEINLRKCPPTFYKTVCSNCKNIVVLIKRPDPPMRTLPEETDYVQEYYKRMLERGLP